MATTGKLRSKKTAFGTRGSLIDLDGSMVESGLPGDRTARSEARGLGTSLAPGQKALDAFRKSRLAPFANAGSLAETIRESGAFGASPRHKLGFEASALIGDIGGMKARGHLLESLSSAAGDQLRGAVEETARIGLASTVKDLNAAGSFDFSSTASIAFGTPRNTFDLSTGPASAALARRTAVRSTLLRGMTPGAKGGWDPQTHGVFGDIRESLFAQPTVEMASREVTASIRRALPGTDARDHPGAARRFIDHHAYEVQAPAGVLRSLYGALPAGQHLRAGQIAQGYLASLAGPSFEGIGRGILGSGLLKGQAIDHSALASTIRGANIWAGHTMPRDVLEPFAGVASGFALRIRDLEALPAGVAFVPAMTRDPMFSERLLEQVRPGFRRAPLLDAGVGGWEDLLENLPEMFVHVEAEPSDPQLAGIVERMRAEGFWIPDRRAASELGRILLFLLAPVLVVCHDVKTGRDPDSGTLAMLLAYLWGAYDVVTRGRRRP